VKARLPIFLGLCALLTGCGYILAGEWRDDPKNWKRAFGVQAPEGLIIHHSYYGRYPHFTTEWCYYFELEDSETAREAIGMYAFLRHSQKKPVEVSLDAGRPSWFLKKISPASDIWEYPGAKDFLVVLDPRTGHIFIHDQQL
jgi:hypothetical protein